jgi:hypothetical protein
VGKVGLVDYPEDGVRDERCNVWNLRKRIADAFVRTCSQR